MKRITLPFLALLAAFSLTLSAHADTLTTFNLTNVTLAKGGGTVTGDINVDVTTGNIVSQDLTVMIGSKTYNFTTVTQLAGIFTYSDISTDGKGDTLDLILPTDSLKNYKGGNLCSTAAECKSIIGYISGNFDPLLTLPNNIATGTLSPTPEPSSLVLLGTGLAGAAGFVRRKYHRA